MVCHDMALLLCIFAVEKLNNYTLQIMNRYYKPYDCDLREYEACLASSREIWDDFSHEWTYSTFDEKLVILAGFVLKGGDLKRAIERYAEERTETYRSRIHWVVFRYIWRMMMGKESTFGQKPTADRIKRLEMDELLRLLAEELKMCVKRTTEFVNENRYKPNSTPNYKTYESWIVSDEYKYNDTILDTIEREHWRANPDESFEYYLGKCKRWERKSCFF